MTTASVRLTPLADTACGQDGVLSRTQALAGGMTPAEWRWRLRSGRWRTLLPGIAVTHSGTPSDVELAWAAALRGGPEAFLTGDAALRQWGMALPVPDVWHVAVPAGSSATAQLDRAGPRRLLRVQPHRVVRLADVAHPVRRPPVVRPAAAVLHAAAWASTPRAAEWRVAAAVQQRLVTPAQLREAQGVLARLPRRRLVAVVLDDVELGAHARSELDLLAFLRRHGLPLPDRLQRPARAGERRCYVDAWWERQRVALEVDGVHHLQVGTWEADLLRADHLAVASRDQRVLLLRLTQGQLRHDAPRVVALLRRALL